VRLSMNVMPRIHRWTFLTLSMGALSVVACAASPQKETRPSAAPVVPAEAPPPSPAAASSLAESEPRTLAEAEAQLERAQAELDRVALLAPSPEGVAAAPQAAPPRDRALPKRAERAEADAESAPPADNPCQTACRAFSSLARASDAVCRLATDGGARCERAKQLREEASRRVASCGCGA
jgi:hypothetical protein